MAYNANTNWNNERSYLNGLISKGGGKGGGHHGRQRPAGAYHAAGSRDDDPESDKITVS